MGRSSNGADVLVVGGGTAGCVLAARLSEDPGRAVTVVEAGPDVLDPAGLPAALLTGTAAEVARRDPAYLWSYDVELRPGAAERQIRGRLLGGSSSVNGSNFMRGLPADYDSWGSELWRWEAVLPAFRRLETDADFQNEFHGTSGPVRVWRRPPEEFTGLHRRFYEAAIAGGHRPKADLNHPVGEGIGPQPRNDHDGVRMSTALTYLAPVRRRPNLRVLARSTVLGIEFTGTRATGVRVAAPDGTVRVHQADHTILCAGTFGSAQLLLLSGVGPADPLRALGIGVVADVPGVGRNLRCQPSVWIEVECDEPANTPDRESARLQTCLVCSAPDASAAGELAIVPRRLDDRALIQCSLRVPVSTGRLTLATSAPGAAPRIEYGYLAPADLVRLRGAVRIALDLLEQPATRRGVRLREPERAVGSDEWILERLRTPFHGVGTCRMGAAYDPLAVVDERCRVSGVDGLSVIDLSIVPNSVRAGPAATAVMVAERAAELIGTSP